MLNKLNISFWSPLFTAAGDRSRGSAGELESDGGGEEESLEGETQLANDDGIVIICYRIATNICPEG